MLAQEPFFPDVPADLRALFEGEGISLIGIADADVAPAEEERYRNWIDSGRHGEMGYLRDHAPMKYRPDRILTGCRSILSVALNYYQPADWRVGTLTREIAPTGRNPRDETRASGAVRGAAVAEGTQGTPPPVPLRGRVARYAWGRDYHRVLGKRLSRVVKELRRRYLGAEFRSFTDATPLSERHYGESGGIGFTGRNTLLISGQYGSWFFVGEILSTIAFAASRLSSGRHGACPISCRRCIDVCPTGALEGPHRIDARRCISYLTIEHSGSIPEELRPQMGDWIFGCDLCQEVCPLNVRARVTEVSDFVKLRAGSAPDLEEIMNIETREQFVSRFAGTPLMRPGRIGMIRNACVAAGNVGDRRLMPTLRRLSRDESPIIREHAQWAVRAISSRARELSRHG